MDHICDKGEEFEEIKKKIKSQKILSEEVFAKVQDVEKSLDEHRTAQEIHEKELSKAMYEINKTMTIVNTQLIPAFDREQKAIIAKDWIKEQARSGKFWAGVFLSIASFLGILGWVIKQSLK